MAKLASRARTRVIEHFQLQTDAARALRGVVAFALPLAVCHWLKRPEAAVFISLAGLNLSLPDLRGAYGVRLTILTSMTLVAAASALIGTLSEGSLAGAVLGMGAIALLGGFWRHLSADYGPALAVSSALLFLLGLSQPGGWMAGWHLAGFVMMGGAVAAFLHAVSWFTHPQHGLRYAVAETWVAASDLVAAMRPELTPKELHGRSAAVAKQEQELRAALDRTFVILGAADNSKQKMLLLHLEEMRREVVHLTMRIIAFHTSLEAIVEQPNFSRCLPVVDSVLKALSDAARSVALALIMHRAENFAATRVRLRRCQHLIKALDEHLALVSTEGMDAAQMRATLEQLAGVLPRIQTVLSETSDHSVRGRDFSASLPSITARSIKSLGTWIHPASQPDPVLIRHAVRMAVFTMLAVGLYKAFSIPHGYWIAFTIMVVLQPDYGSTRQRAGARIAGTLAGSVLSSALLLFSMPLLMVDGLAAITAFIFAYLLKRSYGVAILFVTINLVLITETLTPVHQDLLIVRVLSTLLGGVLALVAARIFWPVWEGEKVPTLLAAAIRANRTFLQSLSAGLEQPRVERLDPLMAKRRAENANRYVSASVERLMGEPAGLQEKPERAAALATYNQRVTRALTVLAVQTPATGNQPNVPVSRLAGRIGDVLETLAQHIERGCPESAASKLELELSRLETGFSGLPLPLGDSSTPSALPAGLIGFQLAKTIAEIRAMTLALKMTT